MDCRIVDSGKRRTHQHTQLPIPLGVVDAGRSYYIVALAETSSTWHISAMETSPLVNQRNVSLALSRRRRRGFFRTPSSALGGQLKTRH